MPEAVDHQAKDLLAWLSRSPRFAGSEAEAEARKFCRSEVERAGLRCTEREFGYSQWPGLWGPPVASGVQLVTILIVARTARNGEPFSALVLGIALFVVLAILSRNARRRWVTAFPFLRAKAINLEASRGNPSLWLVAHIDTKSQTVPMLYRIGSVVVLNLMTVVALGALFLQLAGNSGVQSYWLLISLVAGIASIPSLLCFVRNDSQGAVDNASGVAAVLLAVRKIPGDQPLGVLITSGEELGLAGARAWAEGAPPNTTVVNCDTIDDAGKWLCMHTGGRPA